LDLGRVAAPPTKVEVEGNTAGPLEHVIVEVVANPTVGCEVRRLIRGCRGLSTELEAASTIDPAAAEQDRTRHGGTGHGVHRLVPWEGAFWHRTTEIEGPAT